MSRIRSSLAAELAAVAAAALLVAGLTALGPARTAQAASWTTVWRDDFSGSGRLSSAWLYRTGTQIPGGPANFGTGEVESNTDSTSNVYQSGGLLHIKATRDSSGAWTSGRIETVRDSFQPPAGGVLAVEARLQLPDVSGAGAAGYWPAFWMLGAPYRSNLWSWPGVGELDIMENVQGLNTEYGTMHCGTSPGGPCNEKDGLSANTSGGSPSLQTGMHKYRVEWDESLTPHAVRWYLDGRLFHTVTENQVPADTWNAAFDHGYYLIFDLAMGGEFPAKTGGGPTAQTASGGQLLADYVSVMSRGGSGSAGSPTPTPTPTPTTTTPTPTASATPTPTPTATSSTGARDASTRIQAESFDGSSGVSVVSNSGGGSRVDQLANGDWLRYRGVSFGTPGPRTFTVQAASGAAGGVSGLVEVRLDSRTAPVLGSCALANTGGWEAWTTVPCNVDWPTGTHDLYLTFTSAQPAPFVSLDWFSFS